jgi:hypothetical protein
MDAATRCPRRDGNSALHQFMKIRGPIAAISPFDEVP